MARVGILGPPVQYMDTVSVCFRIWTRGGVTGSSRRGACSTYEQKHLGTHRNASGGGASSQVADNVWQEADVISDLDRNKSDSTDESLKRTGLKELLNMAFMNNRTVAALVLSALTLAAAAGLAMAQPGGGGGRGRGMFGGGENMIPPVSLRQVEQFSKIVGMTADQKEAADALLEGYSQQAAVAAKAMRQASDKARESMRDGGQADPAVWQGVQDAMTTFRDERKKLDDGLMNDMKAILSPEQVEKWPAVERAHRREGTLRWGRMSGERVDLVDLTQKQTLPEESREQVLPLLIQYEEDLDRELLRRNELYQTSMEKMGELRRRGDMDAMQDMIEKGREAGKRVRELNRKYFRQIMDSLPEDNKAPFQVAFKEASYPDVFRKGYAGRVAEAAGAMVDLSSDQKDKVGEIAKRYQTALAPLNEKTAVAQEESEEKFNLREMAGRGWRQEGPVADLRRERRDLDSKLIGEIKGVLSEEQATRLPERTEDEEGADRQRGRNRENAARPAAT